MTAFVAPARYVLTELHRQDPSIPPVTAGPDRSDGVTACLLPMLCSELWQPVQRQGEEALCPSCFPGEGGLSAVPETEVGLW